MIAFVSGFAALALWATVVAASACGSDVTAPTEGSGGAGGAGGTVAPSHCVGLEFGECCAENVNGCLWMDFGPSRTGECVAEQDMCEKDQDDDCPDGFLCRTKFADGFCDDGTSEPMGVCYSPEEWDCPAGDDDWCTWIGD